MEVTEQTIQKIERAVKKIAQKFPANEEPTIMTDIHLLVSQESGELLAFDDDENEITRCVVDQWIDNKEDNFYDQVTSILRSVLESQRETIALMSLLKPFSFVLENDDKETIAELFVSDDDTVIIGGDIMPGLDKELDSFLSDLLKEE
ncbi:MAG: hypothetical protein MR301_00165 [Prevotella sp.]|nr:hypothetical protein [Prevotella sp.]MDD7046624.1 hypothetical protein [Prevotella sp.]MDY5546857.1 hypothetical protein [Prevotella sp.]